MTIEILENAVKNYPNRPAIQFENGSSLSYVELDEYSTKMAHFLIQKGVKKGEYVGVYLPRGLESEIVQLAIYKIGAVFSPIGRDTDMSAVIKQNDQLQPNDQIKRMITKGRVEVKGSHNDVSWINLDEVDLNDIKDLDPQLFDSDRQLDDIVNLFTTSGTTSAVNLVPIKRRGYIEYWGRALRQVLSGYINKYSRVSSICQIGFDARVFESQVAQTFGAQLLITSEQTRTNPQALLNFFAQHQITHAVLIPTQIQALIKEKDSKDKLSSLKLIFTTGEKLTQEIVKFCDDNNIVLINCYGSTEQTYGHSMRRVTSADISAAGLIPIGCSHSDENKEYIIDEEGNVVEGDGKGELYIASPYLTPGYLNTQNDDPKKFVMRNLDGELVRLFRTGDIVERDSSGDYLYYHHRITKGDVKITGVKVSPKYIEHLLLSHPDITNACVEVIKSEKKTRLVAFVEEKSDRNLESIELSRYLENNGVKQVALPRIFISKSFPFTKRGKLDRACLVELAKRENIEQDTYLEKLIFTVFQIVLCEDDEDIDPHEAITSNMTSSLGFTIDPDKPLKYNGINSMQKLRIFQMLSAACKVKIPETSFKNEEEVTIRRLVDIIQEYRWKKFGDPLTLIKMGNTDQHLYILPPITGESTSTYKELYTQLSESFSDGTCPGIYVINARGLLNPMDANKSLDFIAKDYANAIINELPDGGDICLLGWSYGCTLVRKVCEILENKGRPVKYLGLIDGHDPDKLQKMDHYAFEQEFSELIFKLKAEGIINSEEKTVDIDKNLEKIGQIREFFKPLLRRCIENSDGTEFLIIQQIMCNLLASLTAILSPLKSHETFVCKYNSHETLAHRGDDTPSPTQSSRKTYKGDHFSLVEDDEIVKQLSNDIKNHLKQCRDSKPTPDSNQRRYDLFEDDGCLEVLPADLRRAVLEQANRGNSRQQIVVKNTPSGTRIFYNFITINYNGPRPVNEVEERRTQQSSPPQTNGISGNTSNYNGPGPGNGFEDRRTQQSSTLKTNGISGSTSSRSQSYNPNFFTASPATPLSPSSRKKRRTLSVPTRSSSSKRLSMNETSEGSVTPPLNPGYNRII